MKDAWDILSVESCKIYCARSIILSNDASANRPLLIVCAFLCCSRMSWCRRSMRLKLREQLVRHQPLLNMLIACTGLSAAWASAFLCRFCSPGELNSASGNTLHSCVYYSVIDTKLYDLWWGYFCVCYSLQASNFTRCQDSSCRGPAVLRCYQRGACSPRFVHVQRQDQTVCRQRQRNLQQGEVQWWKMAHGQCQCHNCH